jgi:hypothetical protein
MLAPSASIADRNKVKELMRSRTLFRRIQSPQSYVIALSSLFYRQQFSSQVLKAFTEI